MRQGLLRALCTLRDHQCGPCTSVHARRPLVTLCLDPLCIPIVLVLVLRIQWMVTWRCRVEFWFWSLLVVAKSKCGRMNGLVDLVRMH